MYKDILEKIIQKDIKKSEETFSEEDILQMFKSLLLEKSEKYEEYTAEELEKGFRDAFKTGLSVLGLIHGAYYMGQPMETPDYRKEQTEQTQPVQQPQAIEQPEAIARPEEIEQPEDSVSNIKNNQISSFLNAISMNESSGGINTSHRRMEGGIHAGDAAVGKYGLMPNTVKNIVGTMDRGHELRTKYRNMENEQIEQSLAETPEDQDAIAGHLANKLYSKFGGDEKKMAYSWNQGHNLQPKHFEGRHRDYSNHDYVKKYVKHRKQNKRSPANRSSSN